MKGYRRIALAIATAATLGGCAYDGPRDGYRPYRSRVVVREGWDGPVYVRERGPHRGYYSWNGGYYRRCGYRDAAGGPRAWRCY